MLPVLDGNLAGCLPVSLSVDEFIISLTIVCQIPTDWGDFANELD